jgi:hypothetical protein
MFKSKSLLYSYNNRELKQLIKLSSSGCIDCNYIQTIYLLIEYLKLQYKQYLSLKRNGKFPSNFDFNEIKNLKEYYAYINAISSYSNLKLNY